MKYILLNICRYLHDAKLSKTIVIRVLNILKTAKAEYTKIDKWGFLYFVDSKEMSINFYDNELVETNSVRSQILKIISPLVA